MPLHELAQQGLTGSISVARIPLLGMIRISSSVYYNNSRSLCIKKGERVIIIKAHLDGVGRGEWGEAHILAHKAGYVCIPMVGFEPTLEGF